MPDLTLLGLDYGSKRIGVAIGQTITGTARPLTQIDSIDWSGLQALVKEWQPGAFVVGLPINMDDSDSKISKAAKQFAKKLQQKFELPVHLSDERLSSREALERLELQGNTKPSKAEVNAMAAAVILQSWLRQYST